MKRACLFFAQAVVTSALLFNVASAQAAMLNDSLAATSYDLVNDFGNSVFTYGYSVTEGAAVTLYNTSTVSTNGGTVTELNSSNLGQVPWVAVNSSAATWTYSSAASNVVVPAGWITLHPGSAGQLSNILFTAPTAGTYAIDLTYAGADSVGSTSQLDIDILRPGSTATQLFATTLSTLNTATSHAYSGQVSLQTGEQIDIAVGLAPGVSYNYDSTLLQGSISNVEPVPLPASAWLMLSSLCGIAVFARTHKSKCSQITATSCAQLITV